MKIIVVILVYIITFTAFAAGSQQLTAAEWAQPKRADTVMQMAAVRESISQLNEQAGSILIIRYPGGESGILWASELKGWLVALGVSSSLIKMQPGSSDTNVLDLSVQKQ